MSDLRRQRLFARIERVVMGLVAEGLLWLVVWGSLFGGAFVIGATVAGSVRLRRARAGWVAWRARRTHRRSGRL